MANYVSFENAQVLVQEINDKIDSKFSELGGAYIARGSRAFADLPGTLTESMVGYVYNITDDFETDNRFVDGSGKKYSAGTNVVVVDNGLDGSPDYKLDVLGSFVDVEAIEDRIQDVAYDAANDNGEIRESVCAAEFNENIQYNPGDIVWHAGRLYKCALAYDKDNYVIQSSYIDDLFEPVTVVQLIDSAEPDSLTQEQMNSLLAIL